MIFGKDTFAGRILISFVETPSCPSGSKNRYSPRRRTSILNGSAGAIQDYPLIETPIRIDVEPYCPSIALSHLAS
jgi:hypothetical protein